MRVIGFRLKKIDVERFEDKLDGVKVNTNIDIADIEEVKSGVFKGEQLLGIKFTYTLDYSPNFAKIDMGGNLVVGLESGLSRAILKEWKDKQIPADFKINLLNLIIRKCSVRALELEDDLGIPYHMQFPSLRKAEEQDAVEEK